VNDQPCGKCVKFDPVVGPRNKANSFGWCAARSVYPAKEGPGQRFPPDVQRVADPSAPAKPLIVYQDKVEKGCTFFQPKEK
jgi:hypothetical protein